MDEQTQQSVRRIIDYLGDEFRHWEESGRPANHIANDVARLQAWLKCKTLQGEKNINVAKLSSEERAVFEDMAAEVYRRMLQGPPKEVSAL
jgi:isochorismate hydrolase